MGLLSHIATLGVGIFVGIRLMKPTILTDETSGPWVRLNSNGMKVGEKNVVNITDDHIDIWEGTVHIDRKK